jgi:hypothetical protein
MAKEKWNLKEIGTVLEKEYGTKFTETDDGSIESMINLSGIQIKAKQVKIKGTKYIEIQVTFTVKGKPFIEIESYRISGDGTYTIVCDDNFNAQYKMHVNN